MSYVLCPMSLSFVLCLMSYVLCLMSYVLCRMLHVICHISYVLCLLSYVICLMSYVIQAGPLPLLVLSSFWSIAVLWLKYAFQSGLILLKNQSCPKIFFFNEKSAENFFPQITRR